MSFQIFHRQLRGIVFIDILCFVYIDELYTAPVYDVDCSIDTGDESTEDHNTKFIHSLERRAE